MSVTYPLWFYKKDFWAFMQRLEAEAIKHEEVEEELARQKGKNQPSTTKLPIKTIGVFRNN